MTDRHKNPPVALRLPENDRAWLLEYAAMTGRPVNAVVVEALSAFRKRTEARARRQAS